MSPGRSFPATPPRRRFALPLPDLAVPVAPETPTPVDPALLEAARAEGEADGIARGFADGLAEGMRRQAAAQEASVAASCAAIAAALQEAAAQGAAAAEEAAQALSSVLLAAMDAALPEETARRGGELVARVAAALLPAIADRPEAKLRVAPAIAQEVSARLREGPDIIPDQAVPPGDARIEWRDGAQIIALATRRAAVRAALEQAGFRYASEDA
jgi:flagellar assembly protein FliH